MGEGNGKSGKKRQLGGKREWEKREKRKIEWENGIGKAGKKGEIEWKKAMGKAKKEEN